MQWWIAAAGLALLFVFFLSTRKKPFFPRRESFSEETLSAEMAALAEQKLSRRRVRLLLPASERSALEKTLRFLDRLPEDELLPASRCFCENGRYLQEEAAALQAALKGVRLPAFPDGECRIACFSREFLAHTAGELRLSTLTDALTAWQKVQPFSEEELTVLPQSLRLSLLLLLNELSYSCVQEQSARRQADRLCRLLEKGRERSAMALFRRHSQNDSFLERLVSRWRQGDYNEQLLWLESQLSGQERSAEAAAEQEHERQVDAARWCGNAIASLHAVEKAPWNRLLEEWSDLHRLLCEDEVYPQMDQESRAYYRRLAAGIGREAKVSAQEVCEAALELASSAEGSPLSHVGYYLADEGLEELTLRLKPEKRFLPLRLFFRLHGKVFFSHCPGFCLRFCLLWQDFSACLGGCGCPLR